MLATLSTVFGFLTGLFPTINGITNAISNEKIAGIKAATEEEKVHSAERVSTLQVRRDVLIAESTRTWTLNGLLRVFIAIGPAAYVFKVFLWDKVLGTWTHGSTDPLDPNLWLVVQVVLGFYFLSELSFFRRR